MRYRDDPRRARHPDLGPITGGNALISDLRSAWSGWVDRFLSWGMLVAIVAVALVGLALLTSIKHPAAGAPAAPVTVLMSQPIDSALPSVKLAKRPAASTGDCNDAATAGRAGACAQSQADPASVPGASPGH
jgi:hypothetical protein